MSLKALWSRELTIQNCQSYLCCSSTIISLIIATVSASTEEVQFFFVDFKKSFFSKYQIVIVEIFYTKTQLLFHSCFLFKNLKEVYNLFWHQFLYIIIRKGKLFISLDPWSHYNQVFGSTQSSDVGNILNKCQNHHIFSCFLWFEKQAICFWHQMGWCDINTIVFHCDQATFLWGLLESKLVTIAFFGLLQYWKRDS